MSVPVGIAKNSLQHSLSKYYMPDIKGSEFPTSKHAICAVLTYVIESISTAQRGLCSKCGIEAES